MSKVEFHNLSELNAKFTLDLAKIHLKIPKEWQETAEFNDELIHKISERLKSSSYNGFCLVGLDGEVIVAYHWIERRSDSTAEIMSTWVKREFRHQGLSKTLKQKGEQWAIEHGFQKIITKVRADNQTMLKINEHNGYSIKEVLMEKVLT